MDPFKIFNVFRLWAGTGITAGIYAHQVHFVTMIFGFNLVTAIYLLSLLLFYVYIILLNHLVREMEKFNRFNNSAKVKVVKATILALNMLFTFYDVFLHESHGKADTQFLIYSLVLNVFVAFPDYILNLFNRRDDDDDKKPIE